MPAGTNAGRPAPFGERLRRARDSASNAFITLAPSVQARSEGALEGTVAGIKDNMAVQGLRMTCASRMLEHYVAPYDATVVERLRHAGCQILGKNNMDEFACGSSGENSAFGPTLNALLPGRVPGGSSSGSAAAVSEGLVDISIGSDTGGSVRCPSAYCSVVGLKPTYGRVSRYGLVDLAMSLEGPAPIAAFGNERMLGSAMDAMSGRDERDQSTSAAAETACIRELDSFDPDGMSIAVAKNALALCTLEVREAFERSISFLRDRGARVEEMSLNTLDIALPAYYLMMYSEFASAMQRYDGLKFGTRGTGFGVEEAVLDARSLLGGEVKRRILMGTYVTSLEGRSLWYERALAARDAASAEMQALVLSHDLLAMPTMPSPPYALGERLYDPLGMYASDVLTVPANLSGLPAITMPIGSGIGLQLIGAKNRDERLLSAVRFFSKSGWRWRTC